ncbi:MAG: DUF2202 domain-containing protein [Melioribacteraceae bacterium]|nr:DUF2202 domain-containing protein [Melioribacteraceae bacterium]
MKKRNLMIATFVFALIFVGCKESNSLVAADDTTQNNGIQLIADSIGNLPTNDLSDAEKEGIVFMREEEKLARDVYLYFYEKYGMRIFSNIAKAESTHMAAIKILLDKYDIKDPIINDEIGIFQNEMLAGLYTQLTVAGNVSLVEALKVGLTIEDLDIRDLMEFTENVESEDIILVYNNLTKGSRNHLRAYNRQALQNGGTYEAQFITQELFDSIINSPHERGGGW